jgi:hypothetical protein
MFLPAGVAAAWPADGTRLAAILLPPASRRRRCLLERIAPSKGRS